MAACNPSILAAFACLLVALVLYATGNILHDVPGASDGDLGNNLKDARVRLSSLSIYGCPSGVYYSTFACFMFPFAVNFLEYPNGTPCFMTRSSDEAVLVV